MDYKMAVFVWGIATGVVSVLEMGKTSPDWDKVGILSGVLALIVFVVWFILELRRSHGK